MNRQTQWLFEAPPILESASHLNQTFYSNPEWEGEWELQEGNPYGLGEEEWERSPIASPRRQTIRETVSGFSRYSNAIPPQERAKIARIAQMIVQSYRSGQSIRTVRLVGHADRDVQRGASFEKKISGDRVQQVRTALIEAIERLSKPLGALPPISSRISWTGVAAGATQLIVQNPKTESERSRNRRVEIYLSTARAFASPHMYRSSLNFEVPTEPTWLETRIREFLSRIGDREINRMNCAIAVGEAARRLSQKAPSQKINCQLSCSSSQLIDSKHYDAPFSKSVVCCPYNSRYFFCPNPRCGNCSGVNGRYLVLNYKPLTKVIQNLKCALDRGCTVRAGVLSGLCDDMPDRTCVPERGKICAEHYLLIIGYEGDQFLFWDSAQASNIIRGEHVFGLLHYDPSENRLTTAPVDPTQDTMAVVPTPRCATPSILRKCDAGGQHVFDQRQKRYQVVQLLIAGRFKASNGKC